MFDDDLGLTPRSGFEGHSSNGLIINRKAKFPFERATRIREVGLTLNAGYLCPPDGGTACLGFLQKQTKLTKAVEPVIPV